VKVKSSVGLHALSWKRMLEAVRIASLCGRCPEYVKKQWQQRLRGKRSTTSVTEEESGVDDEEPKGGLSNALGQPCRRVHVDTGV
jgi:hypothetical protein